MMTAEQRDAFTEILCDAREEFTQAFNSESDCTEACSEQIENLSFAIEFAEIKGLDVLCSQFSKTVTDYTDKEQLQGLMQWTSQVLEFIRDPKNPDLAQKLVQYLPEEMREPCLQLLQPAQEFESPHLVVNQDEIANPEPDLQSALVAELKPLKKKLDKIIDEVFGATYASALEVLKERYIESVNCLLETAQVLQLNGLAKLCVHVINNMEKVNFIWIRSNRSQGYLVFQQWPGLVLTYLQDSTNDENCLALINHFELQGWPQPLDESGARELLELLLANGNVDAQMFSASAPLSVKAEDMQFPQIETLNIELFEAFLHDTPNQASELSACIAALSRDQQDLTLIQQAQRITHTIKGAANVTGLFAIANFAHVLEDIFEQLCKPPYFLSAELLVLLQSSSDCMEAMVDHLQGNDELPEDRLELYEKLVAYFNQNTLPQASNDSAINVDEPKEELTLEEEGQSVPVAEVQSHQVETVRVPLNVISSLFQLAEEITIALGSSQEQTQRILKQLDEVNSQDWRVQEHRFELENVVDVRGAARRQKKSEGEGAPGEFDSLEMDQYDEIYDVAHALIESVADARELNHGVGEQIKNLDTLLLQQTRLNKELQRLIKHTRMIPVRSVVPRLQRCIRHAARVTGKLIDFEVIGAETEINEDILDKLIDPIMHLLRNAVDHGIEEAQQRVANKKSSQGKVYLHFGQDGQNLTVYCDDDGAGIDEEKVRQKAMQLGLIEEKDALSATQIRQLILKSGFSTKDNANQVSGRGIGMDAVNKRIRDLGGQLRILPRQECGSRFEIKVPLQLVASNALLVQIRQQWFAIPTRQLDQILAPGSAKSTQLGERDALSHEEQLYFTHNLAELLGLGSAEDGKPGPVLLTEITSEPTAICVDAVISNLDLVIKSTGDYVKNVPGIAGVSILGDGRLVPVLDLPALLERKDALPNFTADFDIGSTDDLQTSVDNNILIVDDSLSVRKSLMQLVGDAGYGAETARDGLEAWEKIQQKAPSMILVDMEMPRMNGIELTSRVRNHEQTKNIPIVMITSRSMQKHRSAAEKAGVSQYMTKPFNEADLLTQIQQCIENRVGS